MEYCLYMRKKLISVLLVIVFAAGLSVMLYPTVSAWLTAREQTKVIESYTEDIESLDDKQKQDALNAAIEYNSSIMKNAQPFELSEQQLNDYMGLLNLDGTGVMGYISIPKIDCNLPIYHTTAESVLKLGVGHLPGSSLPVGGPGTHCVLSGHRGLPSSELFTYLDEVEIGDRFTLTVLGQVLEYEVDQILTVLPDETGALRIVSDQDYCTLVTCTPYGVNTHRLLVRGNRVNN